MSLTRIAQKLQRIASNVSARRGRFVASEIGLFGVVAGLATIFPGQSPVVWLGLFVVGSIFVLATMPLPHLPRDVITPGATDTTDGVCRLEVPAGDDSVKAALDYVREFYGHDAFSMEDLRKWTDANPFIFAVLRSDSGRFLGYFDLVPLEESVAERFMSGAFTERQIQTVDVLPPNKMIHAAVLYLAGICVVDPGSSEGKQRTAKLFLALARFVRKYYPGTRRVLALATTDDGRSILEGLGGKICCLAAKRADRTDMYKLDLDSTQLAAIEQRASVRATAPSVDLPEIRAAEQNVT